MTDQKTQREKFEEAARDLETDDNPEHFKEKLGKLVKQRPDAENNGRRST